jgi:hypothetical protein
MTKEEYLHRYYDARHLGLRAVASDAWDAALSASAATELLEALQWCVSQGCIRYTSRIKGQNDQFCDAVDSVNAAIAKAKGD